MKKAFFSVSCLLLVTACFAQTVNRKLQSAYQEFMADDQLKNAISSLYVIDANTGKVVFEKNSTIGLAPASTQKIITSVTALELLGKDYRFKTYFFGWRGGIGVYGTGDPTLGSWRYESTRDTVVFQKMIRELRNPGGKGSIAMGLYILDNTPNKTIPSGWIYEDIANYYGAAAQNFNWHENQYDVVFIPGKNVGDDALIDTVATPSWRNIINECKTGPAGSGDNAYIYFLPEGGPGHEKLVVTGTVPAGVSRFSISGADYMPACNFASSFKNYAKTKGLTIGNTDYCEFTPAISTGEVLNSLVYTYQSPALDSIIYWFNKKSINLYGEALIRTLAYEKNGQDIKFADAEKGINILQDFWEQKGIGKSELNMHDGSGLSPFNRVTTHAQVEILKYAKTRAWFPYFYDALPEYNGMKLKSGTINDVKGFCGYHKAKDGKEYIISFLVNNYNGRASQVVSKMYKVLDVLR